MLIEIPFGKTTEACELEDRRIEAYVEPAWPSAGGDGSQQIAEALSHPIGSPGLQDLASKAKNALIITSDNTRPVPSPIILPPVIEQIRKGSPEASVRLLVGTGLHSWSPARVS